MYTHQRSFKYFIFTHLSISSSVFGRPFNRTIGLLLLTVFFSSFNLTSTATQVSTHDGVYTSVDLGTSVQRLLYSSENFLFAGANSSLFKLNPTSLQTLDSLTFGPVKDNPNCPPNPLPCAPEYARVQNSTSNCLALFTLRIAVPIPIVIACYSTNQGMCYVFQQNGNLKQTNLIGDPSWVQNYIGSRSSTYTFTGPDQGDRETNSSVIFVGHAYDGRPVDLSPATISIRKLAKTNRTLNIVYNDDKTRWKTFADLNKPFKSKDWPITYLYGFADEDHVYFIKTEPTGLKKPQLITKIVRFCYQDKTLGSYSEIQVTCAGQQTATSATHGPIDDYLRNTFNSERQNVPSKSTSVLYVAFKNAKVPGQAHAHSESRVCAYSLDHLRYEFETAQNACHLRREGKFLETFAPPDSRCVESELYDQKCHILGNQFIAVPKTFDGYLLYGDNLKITSMVSLLQGSTKHLKYTLFIGTENGLVKKIVGGKSIFTLELSKSRIEPDPVTDPDQSNVYLASGQSLIKLPVKGCSFYRDCGSCIESRATDTIDCIWTGRECALNDGSQTSINYCEPKIISFSPKKGPISGGTVVRVKGSDLGFHDETANTENHINVAGLKCNIRSWTNGEVICAISESTDSPKSGPVFVNVKDISARKGYDIIGSARSSEPFHLLVPKVESVEPLISPLSGGVKVIIRGTNLDIGSEVSVSLASIPCTNIQVIDSSFISCTSGRASSTLKQSMEGSIRVFIDSSLMVPNINFTYAVDPIFTSLYPNVTSASSGVNLTINGHNFDSLYKPRLVVNATVPKAPTSPLILESECLIIDPSTLTCPSPILPSDGFLDASITSTVSFANGGSQSFLPTNFFLIYQPDPAFLNEIKATKGILEIKGKHLYTSYGLKVLLVNQQDGATLECKDLKSIEGNTIVCNLPLEDYPGDPTASFWNVTAITGSKEMFIGMVPIEPEESESPLIVASLIAVMLTLLVIGFVLLFILKRNGSLLRKKDPIDALGVAFRSQENGQFQRQGSQNEYRETDSRISGQPLLFNLSSEEIKFLLDPEKQRELQSDGILFSREYLTREKVIGQGNFGLVYQGYLKLPSKEDKIKVAIKTLKTGRGGILTQEKGEAFLAEGLIMKEFYHENVLSLVGVSIDFDGSPMIITPFMEFGDLRSYIQREELEFTVIQLIQFGVQVAQGMVYLSGLKFVHRDLAARNCMVDEFHTVKVADFGLSRDVYTTAYYSDSDNCKPLPRKWMAIESLERGSYDTKSDVWSYGVLLWELLTRGDIPYPDVDGWKMKEYLKSGYRLLRPEHCPPEVYSVMKACWVEDPKSRPSFEEILKLIELAIESNEKKYLEQKTNRNIRYINDPSLFTNPEYNRALDVTS